MRKILETIYAAWTFVCFCLFFIVTSPVFFVLVQRKSWHKHAGLLNKLWAGFVYTAILMPVKIERRTTLDKKRTYIYCPNHNSYLDIPLVGYSTPHFVVFVGKEDLAKIPFFGYMFKKLHIPVNRKSVKSGYRSFELAKEVIDRGHSMLFFPEGGINEHNVPDLKPFKDGAFRVAIEKQIPVVPVTIPYNWIILHDISSRLKWHPMKIIYHEPIETTGMGIEDIGKLKNQVREVIRAEMEVCFPAYFKKEVKNGSR